MNEIIIIQSFQACTQVRNIRVDPKDHFKSSTKFLVSASCVKLLYVPPMLLLLTPSLFGSSGEKEVMVIGELKRHLLVSWAAQPSLFNLNHCALDYSNSFETFKTKLVANAVAARDNFLALLPLKGNLTAALLFILEWPPWSLLFCN